MRPSLNLSLMFLLAGLQACASYEYSPSASDLEEKQSTATTAIYFNGDG